MLPNTRQFNIFETYRSLWGCFFTVNLQIYFESLSPQRENVPELPGVFRLLLRKTGHWPVHDIKSFVVQRANDDLW